MVPQGTAFFPVLITGVLLHVQFSFADLLEAVRWISRSRVKVQKDPEAEQKKARVEEELWELRSKHYTHVSRWLVHLAFFSLVMTSYDASQKPLLGQIVRAVICFGAYTQHLIAAKGIIELTGRQLKILCYFLHIALCFFIIASACLEGTDFAAIQGFQCAIRFSFIFMFCHKQVTIPFQFLFTAADLWVFLYASKTGPSSIGTFLLAQSFVLMMSTVTASFLEMWVRARIEAPFETLHGWIFGAAVGDSVFIDSKSIDALCFLLCFW